MKIQDASDRIYLGRVYELLDRARSSIVISMYVLKPGEDPKHPVNRLLEDLLEARRRGVEVTIYLNTKFEGFASPDRVADGPWFQKLGKAGVTIKLISPVRRLHDKLLIVDRRFVVEGSTNWSVSALTDNFESATIIESRELAASKLRRIGFFPIWDGKARPPSERRPQAAPHRAEFFPAGPPTSIEVPVVLVEGKKYFPAMISYRNTRAMKLLLLLIYLSESQGSRKFWVSPDAIARFLDILQDKNRATVRREIVIDFQNLGHFGDFVKARFYHNDDAEIELVLPEGPTFTVGSDDLSAGELAVLEDNEIFLRLIQARLREEGKRLEDISQPEIEKRFFFDDRTYRRTLRSRKPSPAPL